MRSSACRKCRQVIKGVQREASRRCLKCSRHKERGVVLGGGKSQWVDEALEWGSGTNGLVSTIRPASLEVAYCPQPRQSLVLARRGRVGSGQWVVAVVVDRKSVV